MSMSAMCCAKGLGTGKDADVRWVALQAVGEAVHRLHLDAAEYLAHDVLVRVERSHDVVPLVGEAAVVEQRLPNVAHAHQHGLVADADAKYLLNLLL